MADEPIIQDIELAGADQVEQGFNDIATAGVDAFDQIETASDKANKSLDEFSKTVSDVSSKAQDELKKAGGASDELGSISKVAGDVGQALTATGRVIGQFGSSLGEVGAAVGTFASRVGLIGGAATAAVGGVLALAKSMFSAVDATNRTELSTRQLSLQVKAQEAAFTQSRIAAVNNRVAISELQHSQVLASQELQHQQTVELSELQRQLALGKISQEQYTEQVVELKHKQELASAELARKQLIESTELVRKQQVERAQAAETLAIEQEATEARLRDVAALQKHQEQQKLFNDQAKAFGPILANALFSLGRTVDDTVKKFQDAFGPKIANAIDKLNGFLQQHGDDIVTFFEKVGDEISRIFDKGGKETGTFFDKVARVGQQVAAFFKGVIVPIFEGVVTVLGVVAEAINGIFGTQFTATGLLVIAILLKLTGGFTLLISVLQLAGTAIGLLMSTFGFWLVVIGLVVGALYLLATAVDWKALYKQVKDFVDKAAATVQGWWDAIKAGASDAWDWVVSVIKSACDKIVDFFAPVTNKLVQLWNLAKAVADAISGVTVDAGSGPVDPFNPLGRAGGGPVHGPGTSTSDSILARLSDGEWVMKTRAVQHYGIRFMNAINNMQFPIPQFNMGGLVQQFASPFVVPHFADGGAVEAHSSSSLRPIILNIGNESFALHSRDTNVLSRLTRIATGRQLASTARKPSHYGV